MEIIEKIVFSYFTFLTFTIFTGLASLRLGLIGFRRFETGKVLHFLTHPAWCYYLIMLFPYIFDFAEGRMSALPWKAFTQTRLQHGLFDGLLSASGVLIVDLWLFWIPASLWIKEKPETDKGKRIMVRVINLLLGLLLTQVANPIYRMVEFIFLLF